MSTGTAGTADPAERPPGDAERRREQRGWYFYDFACSVYSTSVLTVFLGPYLTSIAKAAADAEGFVHPLGYRCGPAPSSPTPSRRRSWWR